MLAGWSQVKFLDYNTNATVNNEGGQQVIFLQRPSGAQTADAVSSLSATQSGFMPGSRQNNYTRMMKNNPKLKKQINQQGQMSKPKREVGTAEEKQNKRDRMRKYISSANKQGTPAYKTMIELNGGEAIGEKDRGAIDEYLGISSHVSGNVAAVSEEVTVKNLQGNNSLKQLQEEQREIESKLKFIDGLINQQQTTNTKYFGGGILKKHATDDFVQNLEQYQRAMADIKKTMDTIQAQSPDRSSKKRKSLKPRLTQASSEVSQNSQIAKKYYSQFEEMFGSRQGAGPERQSRQVLSVIPTAVSNTGGAQAPNNNINEPEVDKVSVSSQYTAEGRLYDATLPARASYGSRGSAKSQSFEEQNREVLNRSPFAYLVGETPLQARNIHTASGAERRLSQEIMNTPSMDQNGISPTLKIIKDIVVNGPNGIKLNNHQVHQYNYEGPENGEPIIKIENMLEPVNLAKPQMIGGMHCIDIQLESNKQIPFKPLYEQKAFRPMTQVTGTAKFSHKNFRLATKQEMAQSFEDQNDKTTLESPIRMASTLSQFPIPLVKQLKSKKMELQKSTGSQKKSPIKQDQSPQNKDLPQDLQCTAETLQSQNTSPSPFKENQAPASLQPSQITLMGRNLSSLNHHNQQSQAEILDNSVIYHQDGDHSRGVLYFKNLDSLKTFLLNKQQGIQKRPIFSKKGNTIYASDSVLFGTSNARFGAQDERQRSKALKADILKKRQHLHKTLTNLMPQVQLRSLQMKTSSRNTQNYPQTSENYKSRMNLTSTSGGSKEMHWAPISNIQQYPFNDIMNPDGIIDLRIINTGSTTNNTANGGSNMNVGRNVFSRPTEFIPNVGILGFRSESSPGLHRRQLNQLNQGPIGGGTNSKKMQTFYGYFHTNLDQINSTENNMQNKRPPKPSQSSTAFQNAWAQKDVKKAPIKNELDDKSEHSDSQGTNSSRHTVTRQVVFFKTSQNQRLDNGAFMVQYPQLRPRLANLEELPNFKTDTHTVGVQQQLIKTSTDSLSKQINQQQSTHQQQQAKQIYENSLIKMSQGIERNKIKNPSQQVDQQSVQSRNNINVDDNYNPLQSLNQSLIGDATGKASQKQPLAQSTKQVIFSNYEGIVRPGYFRNQLLSQQQNRGEIKIPPLAQGGNRRILLSSTPGSNQNYQAGYNTTTVNAQGTRNIQGFSQTVLNNQSLKADKSSLLYPLPSSNGQKQQQSFNKTDSLLSPSHFARPNSKEASGNASRIESISAKKQENEIIKSTIPSLKGLIRYETNANPTEHERKSAAKMDLNIAQSKFASNHHI